MARLVPGMTSLCRAPGKANTVPSAEKAVFPRRYARISRWGTRASPRWRGFFDAGTAGRGCAGHGGMAWPEGGNGRKNWSERKDLNLRPPGPKPGALPDCATLRQKARAWRMPVRGSLFLSGISSRCPAAPCSRATEPAGEGQKRQTPARTARRTFTRENSGAKDGT